MSLKYRSEIDGLRAIAVVPVILFHAGLSFASGGFVGVDVFFVISGYLITSLLISDLRAGQFSILRFYERRIRRIAPALLLVIVLTLVAALFLLILDEMIEVFESAAATALFLANVRFWRKTGYFETAAEERPLLHMWSLAVEEQFYIVFPLLLWALWAGPRQRMMVIFAICAALSLIVAEIGWRVAPTANFFLPFSRGWELLAGSMCALWLQDRSPGTGARSNLLSGIGLALILVPIVAFDKFTPSPSLWIGAPVLGTVLIICHAGAGTIAARLLSLRGMVGIGLISYSAYLFHQPILAYARITLPVEARPDWVMLALGLISLPLGYLSWRFVEQPTRKRMSTRAVVGGSLAGFTAITAIGIGASLHRPFIENIYMASLGEAGRANYRLLPKPSEFENTLSGACRFRAEDADTEFEARFDTCLAEHGSAVMLIGGSHAGDLHGVLGSTSDHPFLISITKGFCRPHRRLAGPPPHACHYEGIRDFLSRRGGDVALVLYTQPFFTLFDAYRDTRGTEGFHPELVDQTIAYLASLLPHVPVVMMGPRRTPGIDILRLSPREDLAAQVARLYSPGTAQAEDLADATFRAAAARAGVPYLSMIDLADQKMPEAIFVDGQLAYHDTDHLTAIGERHFGALLRRGLEADESAPAAKVRAVLFPPS